jgi:RNA polymerase sigma factor (sigma-70 family)
MAPSPSPPGDLPPEQLFLEHLELIEEISAQTARRFYLSREEVEDFCSYVKEALIEDGYGVFRKYKGRSNLKTYLSTVIKHLGLDYINHLWGKWRNSEEAKRLGPLAMRLEKLLVRDEYTFDEACQILWTNHGVQESWKELQDIATRLPERTSRHMEGEEELQTLPSKEPPTDHLVVEKELEGLQRRVYAALYRAIKTLSKENQVLLWDYTKFSVADIARIRKVEQKPLYRRIDKLLKELRKALEREGVRREDIEELLRSLGHGNVARPKKSG